jgi:hypothetical protein
MRRHFSESLIFKVEIQERVARGACFEPVGEALPKKSGLAAAPHADNRHRFTLDAGQMDVPSGVRRHWRGERIIDFLPDDLI